MAGPVTITVADVQGRQVYKRTSMRKASIPVQKTAPPGIYLLRVSGVRGVYAQKVVVQ